MLYGIPNCDTVKRTRSWLDGQDVAYGFHDFKKSGVPEVALARWIASVGWERLLNRQGTTWRKLDASVQAGVVDAATAAALMREQPSVIKRPVLEMRRRGDRRLRPAALLELALNGTCRSTPLRASAVVEG